jgi:hypothetical protein
VLEQLDVLVGREPPGREAREVQRRPEPVARPGEVVADARAGQRRVDPDEQDAQAGARDVA